MIKFSKLNKVYWIISVNFFYKKWSFFCELIYGSYCIVPEWSLSNIFKNSFCKEVIENPWKDDVVQIIFHTLDLNLLKILSNWKVQMETCIFIKTYQFFLNGQSESTHVVRDWIFCQILLDILGNATQFEPDVLLIKLVEFL